MIDAQVHKAAFKTQFLINLVLHEDIDGNFSTQCVLIVHRLIQGNAVFILITYSTYQVLEASKLDMRQNEFSFQVVFGEPYNIRCLKGALFEEIKQI